MSLRPPRRSGPPAHREAALRVQTATTNSHSWSQHIIYHHIWAQKWGQDIWYDTGTELTWLIWRTKDFLLCPGVRDRRNSSECNDGMDMRTRAFDATTTSKNNSTSTLQLESPESAYGEEYGKRGNLHFACWFVLPSYRCLNSFTFICKYVCTIFWNCGKT